MENKDIYLRNHVQFVKKYFTRLIDEYKFKPFSEEWHGREHHIIFKQNGLKIEIISEPFELPYVKITNSNGYFYLDANFKNGSLERIRKKHRRRVLPIFKRVWKSKFQDISELVKDYSENGANEHERILKESSLLVFENMEQLRKFPSRDKSIH